MADRTAPTVPTGLTATALGANSVQLAWIASIDAVGVTGYDVFRNGSQIQSIGPLILWADTTVSASTAYSYTVRARDAAGNLSAQSTAASVTTPATTMFMPVINGVQVPNLQGTDFASVIRIVRDSVLAGNGRTASVTPIGGSEAVWVMS